MLLDQAFDAGTPIYTQIMDRIRLRVLTGQWQPGERIPGVRELAVEFGVNPNTMQRSLAELERDGLLHSERTAGRFITRDAERIEQMRRQVARDQMTDFVTHMRQMGYDPPAILEALRQFLEQE